MGFNLFKQAFKGALGAILVLFSALSMAASGNLIHQRWDAIISAKYDNCREALDNERRKLNDRLQTNNYGQMRGEIDYGWAFQGDGIPPLADLIKSLRAGAIIADGGAGLALALRQFLTGRPDLYGIAFGITIPAHPVSQLDALLEFMNVTQRLQYLDGKKIEEMAGDPSSKIRGYFGRVSLLLDRWGALSYTENIAAVLNAYADLLEEGGEVLAYVSEARNELWVPVGTYKRRVKFREMGEWIPRLTGGRLKMIAGVHHNPKPGIYTPYESVLRLRKVSHTLGPISARTDLSYIRDDNPPERRFNIVPTLP